MSRTSGRGMWGCLVSDVSESEQGAEETQSPVAPTQPDDAVMAPEPRTDRRTHVVSVSSGAASAYLWALVRLAHPDAIGVFADVNGEDDDNYRFLSEVHEHVGGELVRLDNGGRTIWDVFSEERFLGNDRVDICARELKRIPIRRWLDENCDPDNTVMHIAIDWTEAHRIPAIRGGWLSDRDNWYRSPLGRGWETAFWMDDLTLDKGHVLDWLNLIGIRPPDLTDEGWPHANCKGGCVRAGHGQWAALYLRRPDAFEEWRAGEERLQRELGKPVTICRDRRGGKGRPMSLTTLAERVDAGEIKPKLSDGGCHCMQTVLEFAEVSDG